MVVGHAPLALLLGDVGHGTGVRAGEHDLRAGVEQRGRAGLLLDRVVPGVDEHDVHRALGAGHLDAAHDRVAQAELLGDRERRHVADLRVAVGLGARPGEHAGEVLEVLHRAEEVAEVRAVALVPGQVEERRVRELARDGLHGVHVAERRADDEVEALARERPERRLGVGALGHVLDVRDVGVLDVLADVLEALVVGLAPAGVVVRPDQDHGDVELALLDLGDLRPGGAPRPRSRTPPGSRPPTRAGLAAPGVQAPSASAPAMSSVSLRPVRPIIRSSSSTRRGPAAPDRCDSPSAGPGDRPPPS